MIAAHIMNHTKTKSSVGVLNYAFYMFLLRYCLEIFRHYDTIIVPNIHEKKLKSLVARVYFCEGSLKTFLTS